MWIAEAIHESEAVSRMTSRRLHLKSVLKAKLGFETDPSCVLLCLGRQADRAPPSRPRGPHYSLPLFWWCGRQTCLPACCRSSRTNSPFTRWFPSRCPPALLLTRPSGKGSVSCGWWMAPGSTSALWYKTKRGFKGACVIKYECEMAWGPVRCSYPAPPKLGLETATWVKTARTPRAYGHIYSTAMVPQLLGVNPLNLTNQVRTARPVIRLAAW